MNDLIQALVIFSKYTNTEYPISCAPGVLIINEVLKINVSEEDMERLASLSFTWDDNYGAFTSFSFGSC